MKAMRFNFDDVGIIAPVIIGAWWMVSFYPERNGRLVLVGMGWIVA